MKSLAIGVSTYAFNNFITVGGTTSEPFAMPVKANQIEFQVTFGAPIVTASMALHGSYDGETFFHVYEFEAAPDGIIDLINYILPFIAVHMDTIDEDIPITVTLRPKNARL